LKKIIRAICNIINNSIKIEDLSGEVTDKLTSDYDSDEETLYPNGIVPV